MNLNEVFAVHTAEDGSDMFTHPHTDYICEHLSANRGRYLSNKWRKVSIFHASQKAK